LPVRAADALNWSARVCTGCQPCTRGPHSGGLVRPLCQLRGLHRRLP
jgi:hypothetical protein